MGKSDLKGIVNLASDSSKITNLNVGTVNTEITHTLQDNVKQIIIYNRDGAITKFSFVQNQSGTLFVTIPPYVRLCLDQLNFTGENLYLQCDKISTVEILELY